jgi:hypothetical protein
VTVPERDLNQGCSRVIGATGDHGNNERVRGEADQAPFSNDLQNRPVK